jgi:hypothetical protein
VESLVSVGSNLFSECLFEFLDQSVVLLTSTITPTAGVSLSVNLPSVAPQALDQVVFLDALFLLG